MIIKKTGYNRKAQSTRDDEHLDTFIINIETLQEIFE